MNRLDLRRENVAMFAGDSSLPADSAAPKELDRITEFCRIGERREWVVMTHPAVFRSCESCHGTNKNPMARAAPSRRNFFFWSARLARAKAMIQGTLIGTD